MLRKSIIMMTLATAFTMNVSAVQIEVPKWQPPVPGADASIPANAYENYSHINKMRKKKLKPLAWKYRAWRRSRKQITIRFLRQNQILLSLINWQNTHNLLLSYFMKENRISVYLYQISACGEIQLNLN